MKLKNGPANTIENLAHFPFTLNEFSASFISSSPTIAHEPPIGSSFHEYFVHSCQSGLLSKYFCEHKNLKINPFFPFATVIILGPIPTENSGTPTPFFFARRKCPSSCITTITVNINNATNIFI